MRGELIPEGSEQFFTQFNPNACVVGADDCITKWYFGLGKTNVLCYHRYEHG